MYVCIRSLKTLLVLYNPVPPVSYSVQWGLNPVPSPSLFDEEGGQTPWRMKNKPVKSPMLLFAQRPSGTLFLRVLYPLFLVNLSKCERNSSNITPAIDVIAGYFATARYRIIIIIIIIIMSYRQHGYPWSSLATSPYLSSPLAGLQGYIPYPHIAAVCMFELVVLLLFGHMWGP